MGKIKLMLFFSIGIAILNVFDGFFTYFGVVNNFIEELNPVMNLLITTYPAVFIGVKILLSLSIVAVSYWISSYGKANFQLVFLFSLVIVFFIYTGIFGLHIYWLSFVF